MSIFDNEKEFLKYKEGQKIKVTVKMFGEKTVNSYLIKSINLKHFGNEFILENIKTGKNIIVDKLWFTVESKRTIEIL